LAREARRPPAAEKPEELFFGKLGFFEQLGAGEDFGVTRSAARGAARKGDGGEVLVGDVD
jgi:hypothetical protein